MTLTDRINAAARKVPTWVVYVLYLLPVPVLLYTAQTGGLGRDPVKGLEHELGEIALQLMVIGLCISPLRRYLCINLLKFRRAIGLLAFIYVVLHLLVWMVLDVQSLERVWADILKRPYITIGMASFVLLLPLALTSSNRAVRGMGASWRRLHMLVYPAALLGAIHFVMVQKVWQSEPLVYVVILLVLVSLRLKLPKRNGRSAPEGQVSRG